ncbi:MAG: PAS domain S-box protein, partial [Candidatus Zixiibacteriota bacterium]
MGTSRTTSHVAGSKRGADAGESLNQALGSIARGVASVTGEQFFRELVRSVADALDTRYAFVAEFPPGGTSVRTLAYWGGDEFLDNVEFELAGTPCEAVIAGSFAIHPERASALFPEDPGLAEMGVESYVGVPLLGSYRAVLGHLALLHTGPMTLDSALISTLQVVASRACMELERLRFETRLRNSEIRLATLIGSTMDAIITIDDARRITLFNTAAEAMFRCSNDAAVGRILDKFLTSQFRAFFDGYLQDMGQSEARNRPLWAPSGLTAVRADGDEFPIEATISPLDIAGRQFFTLILRDVNDRQEAERALTRLRSENTYLQEELQGRD